MARRTIMRIAGASLTALGLLALLGCLERKETIKIEPDGTAHVQVVFNGDLQDVRTGDGMLEDPGPWEVKDEITQKDDGDQELTRTATLTVPPGGDFPTHYAGDDAGLAELALAVSTSLKIEERPDGIYYHFKRVYHRRDWARIDYFRREFLEEGLKKLEEKDQDELTEQDRLDIAQSLVWFEGVKTLVLCEQAAAALQPPLGQDDWLGVHRVLRDVFKAVDIDRVVELLQMEGDQADAPIAAMVQEVNAELESKIDRVLGRSDPSGATARGFLDQLERERRRYAITEDLQDDNFEIVVELPGRIVGHNTFDDVEGNEAEWEFSGKALFDRDQVLLATSVVERE